VHDDGCGFVVPNPVSTFGLRSLQARATILGASLTIRSAPGRGTTIEVLLPLAPNGS
jgi:signal transduction histidine kinase